MENWAKIENSNYSISSEGRVRNDLTGKCKTEVETGDGYLHVDLYDRGQRKTKRTHRLVAEAFIPNPYNLPEVNHKDGNKKNNNYTNLEWVTGSENMQHAYRTKLVKPHATYGMLGKKNPNAGSKGKPIFCVETGEWYKNSAEAERITGISDTCILDCIHGKQHTAGGFHFQYS